MIKGHLDVTLSEAVNRLGGKYDADVRHYDTIHNHILMTADALSTGIISSSRAASGRRRSAPRPSPGGPTRPAPATAGAALG